MKTSISTAVFLRYNLPEALRLIKELGYDGVELWGGRPHAFCEDMTDSRIEEISQLLAELSLPISNFIPAQFRYPVNIAATDETIRKNSVRYLCDSIDVAEKLHAPSVSLCPGFSLYDSSVQACFGQMKKSLAELFHHNEGNETKLLIEPSHPLETDLVVTVADALVLIDEFGKNNLGVCVDTGHMFINKENLSGVIDITKGYHTHFHIDDNAGRNDDHLVMGEGKIDFSVFLYSLQQSGYDGFLTVELGFGYTADPLPPAKRALEFMQRSVV